MKLCNDEAVRTASWSNYALAIPLLAIHSGIAFCDAVLVFKTGKKSTSQNHGEAARRLTKLCGRFNINTEGIKHLTWLISMKDDVAYGDRRITSEEIASSVLRIERFVNWVYNSFPELRA
jgi:hypothetical protein